MMLRRNYYLAVFLLMLPLMANSNNVELTKEDAGITIEDGNITSVIAKLRHGSGDFNSCSFKQGEDVYSIDHAENPAILTIKGENKFQANIDTTFIATNTADGTPTQYHAVYVTNKKPETSDSNVLAPLTPAISEAGAININLGENAKLYGAIKETSSIPVIQVEQANVTITNNGLIEAKGEKQQIAVGISKDTSDVITIKNEGVIIGDIIEEKKEDKDIFELKSTVTNNKQITSGLIRVKTITNNAEAELNLDVLQSAELENHGTCKIDSIDLTEKILNPNIKIIKSDNEKETKGNGITITNKENGVIDIADRIREVASGSVLDVNNNTDATFRIFEGSTLNKLKNEGKLQLVLYQAKQRNAILLNVKSSYTNTGTIEIDAIAGGLKIIGELKDIPLLKSNKDITIDKEKVVSMHPLIEILEVRHYTKDDKTVDNTLLVCDIKIKKLSESYTTAENGFSPVEIMLADSLQFTNDSSKKIVSNNSSILEVKMPQENAIQNSPDISQNIAANTSNNSSDAIYQNAIEFKKYLQERHPDDITSIAFSLQHAAAITTSRIKQRLEQQRKKRTKVKVIYFNKKRKYNFWIKAAYGKYTTKENSLISSLATSAKMRGIVIGVDTKIFHDRTLIGMLTSYTKSDLSYIREQHLAGHTFATGLYGSYLWSELYLDAMIIASKAKKSNTRSFDDQTLAGDISSKNLTANLFLGGNFNIKKFDIDPKIGIQFSYINLGGYSLKNSDASLIETHNKTPFTRTDGIISAKVSKRFDYKRAKIYPSLAITGVFELKNLDVPHTAILANDSYNTLAKLGMKRYIEFAAGVYLNYHNFVFEVNYARSTATNYKSDELQAGIRFNM